ncbi:MAG TPA: hypothetical protein VG675_18055 [Bryobacteraceae bacterium]|nr:hypothetical protein [Bryobacteraceae bacterium]
MATRKNNKKAPKEIRDGDTKEQTERRVRMADLLEKVTEGFEQRLKGKDFKPTVGDYVRLLQLQKEMDQEVPREIEVRWVEPTVTSDAER